jgi:hypothetical protein
MKKGWSINKASINIFRINQAISLMAMFILSLNPSSYAQTRNIKKCTLLPISDNVEGAIAYKVYSVIENELKNSYWCLYRSNSQLLYKFSQFREQLETMLDEPKVLKLVSEKLNVGSIIRINLQSNLDGILIKLRIYGDDGETIFYEKTTNSKRDDIEIIAQQIKQWLEAFHKEIPYDGIIQGVLGDQIMIDVGRSTKYKVGQEFQVKKLDKVVKHPLLKKVVQYQTTELASGKLFNISDTQIVGLIKRYKNDSSVKKGDWVIIEPITGKELQELKYPEIKKNQFGKLGVASLSVTAGDHTVKTKSSEGKKINGNLYGIELKGEIWVTRNTFGQIGYGKKTGNLAKDTNNLSQSSYTSSPSYFKALFGYRFLPLGFYYGPQFDFYGGYTSYTYDVELSAADGFGTHMFTGWSMGIKVDIPLIRTIRGFLRAELMPLIEFEEKDSVYTGFDTASNLQFEIGGKFQWDPLIGITSSVEITSNKAKFTGTIKEVQYQSTVFKVGLDYQF